MTEIKGTRLTTLTVAPGVYKISYPALFKADILNSTDGELRVSDNDEFAADNGAGRYISIPQGCSYNGLSIYGSALYLSVQAVGTVTIVRCG